MDSESKGIAWFRNIYRKFETILQEVDGFPNQTRIRYSSGHKARAVGSCPEKLHSNVSKDTYDESEKVNEKNRTDITDKQYSHHLVLNASGNPFGRTSGQSFHGLENNNSDQKVIENTVKEKACQGVDRACVNSRTSDGPSAQASCDVWFSVLPCEKKIEKDGSNLFRSSALTESHFTYSLHKNSGAKVACSDYSACSNGNFSSDSPLLQSHSSVPFWHHEDASEKMRHLQFKLSLDSTVKQANFHSVELDASSLETIELCDMPNPEDHSATFDESQLYEVWRRTQKHRSVMKKIKDALASKKRLEKEYEQLAIWFGDTDIWSDSGTSRNIFQSKVATTSESKSSQTPLTCYDSDWEML